MALSTSLVWECRASGASDSNGGGFVAGGSGTDYSQQNSAQLSLTDLATTGVVTTLTSATGGFTAAMVGNVINIGSGTNFTAGFYQITARTNSNTVTLDRAPTTAAGSAGHGSVGGALATLNKLAGAMVARNKAYGTGAFTTTATITFAQSVTSDSADPMTRLIGYGTTRGDSGQATLTLQTNTGLTGILMSGNGFSVEQIAVDCASLATSTGISFGSLQYSRVLNCKVANFTSAGISNSGAYDCLVDACEVTGGTSAATAGIKGYSIWFIRGCFVHDNACPGIIVGDQGMAMRNLVVNNTGASADGIRVSFGCFVMANTIHGNGRDGLQLIADNDIINDFRYNLLTSNGRYGLSAVSGANLPAHPLYDGNGYWNNTSGARNGFDNTTGIYAVAPYTNVYDVLLTANPYVGPTTGTSSNFALNNTAGGGAACRAAGQPGTWPGNTGTTSSFDLGAVQHQDTPGAGPPALVVRGDRFPAY